MSPLSLAEIQLNNQVTGVQVKESKDTGSLHN